MRSRRFDWRPPLVAILAMAAFLPALHCGFIWDDDYYVTENRVLRNLDGLRKIWFEPGVTNQYYPAVYSTFWAEYHLWGLKPVGYHADNILLHAANAVLLGFLLVRLGVPGAWLAASIFAVHPVHAESVVWVTERKNVLSVFFYLMAMLGYIRYAGLEADPASAGRRLRQHQYLWVIIFYALALLSKTVTCTFLAAIFLIWWWRGRVPKPRKDLYPLVPLFLITLAAIFVNIWIEWNHVGARGNPWQFTLVDRCLIAGRALWFYASKLLWPQALTFIYPRWRIDSSDLGQYFFPAAVILVLVTLWFFRRRLGKGPLIAVLFFMVTLSPALGFVNYYPMRFSFVADHFQYLASIGLIVLATGWWATRGFDPVFYRCAAAAVLLSLGFLSWGQTPIYKNLRTLWTDTLLKNPNAAIAHNNLGVILVSERRYDEAMSHYQKAVALEPRDEMFHFNTGCLYSKQPGHLQDALDCYRQALRLNPNYPYPHFEMGNIFASQGLLQQACDQYREAIRLDAFYSMAYNSLGSVLFKQGKYREAGRQFARSLVINPNDSGARNNFGLVLAGFGQWDDAAIHFRRAIELKPDFPTAHCNFADLLEHQGKLEEALRHYQEALKLDPQLKDAQSGIKRVQKHLNPKKHPDQPAVQKEY